MLKIDVWNTAEPFLKNLTGKSARQVARRIEQLAENPTPPKSKMLEGFASLRRLRSGDFRIIYFVRSDTLNIVIVDHRNDDRIYRRLKQLFG